MFDIILKKEGTNVLKGIKLRLYPNRTQQNQLSATVIATFCTNSGSILKINCKDQIGTLMHKTLLTFKHNLTAVLNGLNKVLH